MHWQFIVFWWLSNERHDSYSSGLPHWHWYDDIIKWKWFPLYWPFVRGIHWSPVDSPHRGPVIWPLMFSLIWAWTNGWANNREASDLWWHHVLYDVNVMKSLVKHWNRNVIILIIFFDDNLNKRLSRQSRRRWFQTTGDFSRRDAHCDVTVIGIIICHGAIMWLPQFQWSKPRECG